MYSTLFLLFVQVFALYVGTHFVAAFQPVQERLRKDPLATRNLIHNALIPAEHITLPSLHVKLGLVKNFMKRLRLTNTEAFEKFDKRFPRLSKAKKAEGENVDLGSQFTFCFTVSND